MTHADRDRSEPPTVIVPTLRCWRWWAGHVHKPHMHEEPPNERRCPGLSIDEVKDAWGETNPFRGSVMSPTDRADLEHDQAALAGTETPTAPEASETP